MNENLSKPNQLENEKVASTAIHVVEVDKSEFYEHLINVDGADLVAIKVDDWQETGPEIVVKNIGANVCTIIFVINKLTGECISGHFPHVNRRLHDDFIRKGLTGITARLSDRNSENIQIPDDTQAQIFSYKEPFASLTKFIEMKKAITEKVNLWGNKYVEVHVFGQNSLPTDLSEDTTVSKVQEITNLALIHNDLNIELRNAGVPEKQIHDHRSLLGLVSSDSTLYKPVEKIILHLSNKRSNTLKV